MHTPVPEPKAVNTTADPSNILRVLKNYIDAAPGMTTSLTDLRTELQAHQSTGGISLSPALSTDFTHKITQLSKHAEQDYLAAHAAHCELRFLADELGPRLPSALRSAIDVARQHAAQALEHGLLQYSGPAAAALRMTRQPFDGNTVDDASRMGRTPVHAIRRPDDEAGIIQAIDEARRLGLKLSISGARHSQGGQIASTGSLHLNLDNYRAAVLDAANNLLTVQSGALWGDLVPLLDAHGKSLDVLQVPNYFSVGGTLSVNAHGHNVDSGPVASTVQSLRLLLADGTILRASRDEHAELFRLVLGGYGLFGVILDVVLRVRANVRYTTDFHTVKTGDFTAFYARELAGHPQVRYSHNLFSVAPGSFLRELMITRYRDLESSSTPPAPLSHARREKLERIISDILNACYRGPGWARTTAWWLLSRVLWRFAQKVQTRNRVMSEPFTHFSNGRADCCEMLQEYFIPRDRFDEFINSAQAVLALHPLPLVMVAVRAVKADPDAFTPTHHRTSSVLFSFRIIRYPNPGLHTWTR